MDEAYLEIYDLSQEEFEEKLSKFSVTSSRLLHIIADSIDTNTYDFLHNNKN